MSNFRSGYSHHMMQRDRDQYQNQGYLGFPRQSVPVPSSDQDVNQAKFRKTRMCRYLPKCHKGSDCPFAHSEEEVRAPPDLSKTRMCAGFLRNRCTQPAHKCKFAHGEAELRAAPPMPPMPRIGDSEEALGDGIGESSTCMESGTPSECSSEQSGGGVVGALLSKGSSTRASRSRSSSVSLFEDQFVGVDPACQATHREFLKHMEAIMGTKIFSWDLVKEVLTRVQPQQYED